MKRKTNISVQDNKGIRVNSNLIVGEQFNGYQSGDILDANSVLEKINEVVGIVPEDLDTIAEAAEAIVGMEEDISGIQETIDTLDDTYAPKAENGYIENPDIDGVGGQILSLDSNGNTVWSNVKTGVDIVPVTISTTSLSAELSKYYRFDVTVNNLAVTLPSVYDTSEINNIVLYFTAGSTPNVTFVSSASIGYQFGFAISSGKTYEINATWNGSSWIIASVEINMGGGGDTIVSYKISGGYNNTITNIDTEGYSASVQFKDNATAYNARIGASCIGGSNFASPYTSDKKHIVEVELTDDDTSNIDLYLAALSEEITDNNRYNTFNLVAYATVNTGMSKRITLEITDNYSAVYLYTTSSGWNTIKIKSIECKVVNNE